MSLIIPLVRLMLVSGLIGCFSTALLAQIYVANSPAGAISEYDATTGALIKDSLVIGLGHTRAMVYYSGALYVINDRRRAVEKYDAKTGDEINAQLVTGLDMPTALAVSGRDLYVASFDGMDTDMIGKYNAVTGAVVLFKLIPRVNFTSGLAVDGDQLFVGRSFDPHGSGLVIMDKYDAITGRMLKESFIPEMADPAVMAQSGNSIWVSHGVGVITKHDCNTGRNSFGMRLPLISGLHHTSSIAVSGDALFVASYDSDTISKFNASTGAVIDASFITGLHPGGILAAVPSQSDTSGDGVALLLDRRSWILTVATIPPWVVDTAGLGALLLLLVIIVSPFVWMRGRAVSRREAVFPNGIRNVTILSFVTAPTSGCAVISDSVSLQLAGLQVGDIIVALDGIQVENTEQYAHVDAMAKDSNMRWIIWRGSQYLEVTRWVPDRNLESPLKTHSPAAS